MKFLSVVNFSKYKFVKKIFLCCNRFFVFNRNIIRIVIIIFFRILKDRDSNSVKYNKIKVIKCLLFVLNIKVVK